MQEWLDGPSEAAVPAKRPASAVSFFRSLLADTSLTCLSPFHF